jgi:RimJ/RimL family protein N-acetyltransferase
VGVGPVAYRIETERLVIRCYEPSDAPLLKAAIDASLEHLRPWMPWIQFEPRLLAERVELLRSFRGQFDLGTNFVYGVFNRDETKQLGGVGLHDRGGEGSLEIGYWVAVDAIGQGIATEMTAVQTRAGFEVSGLERVDIQIEPTNERSLAIPRRLEPSDGIGPRRDSVLFTMVREELAGSPCLQYDYVAYDVVGNRLAPTR